jgi:hypothetical protein
LRVLPELDRKLAEPPPPAAARIDRPLPAVTQPLPSAEVPACPNRVGIDVEGVQGLEPGLKALSQEVVDAVAWLSSAAASARDLYRASHAERTTPAVTPLPPLTDLQPMPPPTSPPPAPAPASPSPAADAGTAGHFREQVDWYHVAMLQLIGIVAALVGGPLVVVVALAFLLRKSGSLVKVELYNTAGSCPPSVATSSYAADSSGSGAANMLQHLSAGAPSSVSGAGDEAPAMDRLEASPEETSSSTAEQFDLGPSYEEERLAKEEALRLQEQAVLQEIFEQNLKLLEQVEELGEGDTQGAAAPDSPEVADIGYRLDEDGGVQDLEE